MPVNALRYCVTLTYKATYQNLPAFATHNRPIKYVGLLLHNLSLWSSFPSPSSTHRDARLLEVQSHGERFPHEYVRIVTRLERAFKFLQLPAVEVGPRPTALPTASATGAATEIGVSVPIYQKKRSVFTGQIIFWYKIFKSTSQTNFRLLTLYGIGLLLIPTSITEKISWHNCTFPGGGAAAEQFLPM